MMSDKSLFLMRFVIFIMVVFLLLDAYTVWSTAIHDISCFLLSSSKTCKLLLLFIIFASPPAGQGGGEGVWA